MLCYRQNTSQRDSVSPLIAVGAFVVCLCVFAFRNRWFQHAFDNLSAPEIRTQRWPGVPVWFRHAVRWLAAVCFIASPAIAQDHVTRPVKKQWRVASSQHAPPAIPDSDSIQHPGVSDDSPVQQANHQFVDDPAVMHSSPLPITNHIQHGHELVDGSCDASCSDCFEPIVLASGGNRGCGNWISVEYLDYTTSGGDLPPLIQSGPGTILFGGNSDDFTESGIRIGGGWWFDDCHTRGAEIFYSGLPQSSQRVEFDGANSLFLERSAINLGVTVGDALLIAQPAFLAGNASVHQSSAFHHVEALRRDMQFQNSCRRIDSLIGLRYASLEDSLLISQFSTYTAPQGGIITGTTRDLFDRFEASNRFQGLVLGLDYTETLGVISLHARGTLGLGNNRTEVIIDGRTVNTVPGDGAATFNGGLLAQTTNIGTHTKNRFMIMPEVFLGVSARFAYGWEIKAGYQLIYWSDAAQAANQIDQRVSQFPPETPAGGNPAVLMDSGGVLIHGLQTGISLTF